MRKQVNLAGPAAQGRVAGGEQFRHEECVHGVESGQVRVGGVAFHQEIHVEVDDLIVQAVVTGQGAHIGAGYDQVEASYDGLQWRGWLVRSAIGQKEGTLHLCLVHHGELSRSLLLAQL